MGKTKCLSGYEQGMVVGARCNRVILVIPLATLLLSQWVFGFSFVLPLPTQRGILLAGLRSLLTRGGCFS
jgi:hypothetical protein